MSLLRVSDPAGLGVGTKICLSNNSPGGADVLVPDCALWTLTEDTWTWGKGPGGLEWELWGWGEACGLVSAAHLPCVLSVPIPFCGDYIGLQGNPKLQKLKGGEEGPVLMAEAVKKVNRGNGKVRVCRLNSSHSYCRAVFWHLQSGWQAVFAPCQVEWGQLILPFLTLSCSVPRLLLGFSS